MKDNTLTPRFFYNGCDFRAKSTLKKIGRGKLYEGLYIIENPCKAVDSSQTQLSINVVARATPDT